MRNEIIDNVSRARHVFMSLMQRVDEHYGAHVAYHNSASVAQHRCNKFVVSWLRKQSLAHWKYHLKYKTKALVSQDRLLNGEDRTRGIF